MTRLVIAALLAALVGVCVGIEIAPQRPPTFLAYCTADGSAPFYPCPPSDSRWVQAYWPSFQVIARWTGSSWEFQRPILERRSTTTPALAWHELPEATR